MPIPIALIIAALEGAGVAAEGAAIATEAAVITTEAAAIATEAVAEAAIIADKAAKAIITIRAAIGAKKLADNIIIAEKAEEEAAKGAEAEKKSGNVVTNDKKPPKKDSKKKPEEDENADAANNKDRCTNGHPVDMATGEMFIEDIGFDLPGIIPIVWETVWFNSSTYQGPLGSGWSHSYDQFLIEDTAANTIIHRTADGRDIGFPYLAEEGASYYKRSEKTTLHRQSDGYKLDNHTQQMQYIFKYNPIAQKNVLERIYNADGAAVKFEYENGLLIRIIDSCQRILVLSHNKVGQVIQIALLNDNNLITSEILIRYVYDNQGCLTSIIYPLNHAQYFYYNARNQIIKHTLRSGINFYFEYDGIGPKAKCPRTWGDGNVLGYHFTFEAGKTISVNSLGHTTTYYHKAGLVYKTIDPYGHITHKNYNQYRELIAGIDALGNTTVYAYDGKGNLTTTFLPNGAAVAVKYNKQDLPAEATDADGSTWKREYDEAGHIIKQTDPLQQQTTWQYDSNGNLSHLTDALGRTNLCEYDSIGQLIGAQTPNGQRIHWRYNYRGQRTATLYPNGTAQRLYYDAAGNIVKTEEPDGNVRHITYDAAGSPLHIKDNNTEVTFKYDHTGKLISRRQGGQSIRFTYDTELNLTSVINEEGSRYLFELDANGRVITETGFDGLTRRYQRDAAGQVTAMLRPAGYSTQYRYDRMGRVTDVQYHADTAEAYSYSPGGLLLTADNEQGTVIFAYDALGQVLAEGTAAANIKSVYNAVGQRTALTSTLGAHMQLERDIMGDISHIDAGSWQAAIQRSAEGWETGRLLPGDISSEWQTDGVGRPVAHQVLNVRTLKTSRQKRYSWRANNRLHEVWDTLHRQKTFFAHDAAGRLIAASHSNGGYEVRSADATGNLFESAGHEDRKYAKGGRLTDSKTAAYRYDEEGNLAEKRGKDGQVWKYSWNAAGMLAKVTRPDGAAVTFGYDALGRRVWKRYKQTITKYVWDGNKPLHEWKEFDAKDASPDDLITWIFEEDSLAPAAKLKGDKKYSIVADHLGTPVQGFNGEGTLIWERELDIYGRVKMLKGEEGFCNYLYQGQTLDNETGLAYNRFRYYSPEEGIYIAQDPIGLAGGMALYGYVHDTNGWVDIFGLCGTGSEGESELEIDENKGFRERREFGKQHGQKVYEYEGKYYSKDADGHSGGAWKVFEKSGGKLKRIGTADKYGKIFKK